MKDSKRKMGSLILAGAILLLTGNAEVVAQEAGLGTVTDGEDTHDVSITRIVENEVALRCDTCATTQSLVNAAMTRLPTARFTDVYAMNVATGAVVGIYLNYLGPGELDVRTFAVDPVITQWVSDVGRVYRDNGNSLSLRLVARADGSMYWVRANGTHEELKDPDQRLHGTASTMDVGNGINDAPPNSAPIDARGYQFPSNFSSLYPAFPPTSYDMAYNSYLNVNSFVRDQAKDIQYGTATGVINGTVSASTSPGIQIPVVSVGGGVTVTNTLTSAITVYVPMQDGGFVRVSYDKKTHDVTVLEITDAQGMSLPTNKPDAKTYIEQHPMPFVGQNPGPRAFESFRDWALRNGIPVVGGTPWYAGGMSCSFVRGTDGGGSLTCTRQY